nr:putative ribonuclease h protein [Quercus suber]
MRGDQRKKGNTSGQVNSDTAVQKVTQGGGPMEDRTSEINEPIIREEDVMEVAQPRATTGENSESLQLEREAENQGDYFEEKINEIDSDLMKFELKKDSGNECAVNKETAVDLEGETENSGEMLNILPRGLEASEKLTENKKHVTEEEENPKIYATHVLDETKEAKASSCPTWKRIVRKETGITRIATPLRTSKRSSAELFEAELPRKKKQIFKDNWIPGCPPTKAVPRMQECEDDATVNSLMDQTTMEWNGHMIDQKVASYLTQRIKAIPLCRTPQEDCLVWPRSRDGNYSVKTEYQLLCELQNRETALVSNGDNSRNFWRGIWRLRIPNKIKHFGWRACTESLPTLANLYRSKVVTSPFCCNCDRACETTIHALWECDKVLGCWGHSFKNLRSQELGVGSFADLEFKVRKQGENMELFMIVAWLIWSRRNKMHFNEQHLPPEKILDAATALLGDFHEKPDSKLGRNLIRPQRWVPPAEGMYKAAGQ